MFTTKSSFSKVVEVSASLPSSMSVPTQRQAVSTSSDISLKTNPNIPNLLGGVIEQLWPEWTEKQYSKYFRKLERFEFPAESPTGMIREIIEGTSVVYKLTSETPPLVRDLFIRIAEKYQWTIKIEKSPNVVRDKAKQQQAKRGNAGLKTMWFLCASSGC